MLHGCIHLNLLSERFRSIRALPFPPRMTSKRPARPDAGAGDAATSIEGLVQSIRTHKRFKRLAGYSIQCLLKVIAPPAGEWEAAAARAQRAGVLDAVAEVSGPRAGGPAG